MKSSEIAVQLGEIFLNIAVKMSRTVEVNLCYKERN